MASSVDGVVGFGVLPSPALGVQMHIRATPPRFWAVEVFGRVYASQNATVAAAASVRLASTSGGLAICPLHLESDRRLALDLCAGGEFAAIESASGGFSGAQSQTGIVVRLLASGHAAVPLGGPFAVRFGGELGLVLARDDFVYQDSAGTTHDVFNPSLVVAAADLGLLLSLP
jgi:hypothetical protein